MKQINYLIRIRNTLKLAFPPHTECGERQTISVMTGGTLLKTVFNLTSQGQWAPTTVSGSGWKLCAFPKDGGRVAWQLNISNIATRAKTFPCKKVNFFIVCIFWPVLTICLIFGPSMTWFYFTASKTFRSLWLETQIREQMSGPDLYVLTVVFLALKKLVFLKKKILPKKI